MDLQLLAMVQDARAWLAGGEVIKKVNTYNKFLMLGFSASAQFTSRFITIHPEHVKAAIYGSPGGWPLVLYEEYNGTKLDYPIGISDIEKLSGKPFNLNEYKKVPTFYYLGDKDENDAVVYRDAYSVEHEKIIFRHFGEKPTLRWGVSTQLLRSGGANLISKLYPDVGHMIPRETNQDIQSFILQYRDGEE